MDRWLASIYSDTSEIFIAPKNPQQGQPITIRLRVDKKNSLQKISLRVLIDGEEELIVMKKYKQDEVFDWYKAKTTIWTRVLCYRFRITGDRHVYWYNAQGIISHTPTDIHDFRVITNFSSPSWLRNRVFYQIFPDTFSSSQQPKLRSYTYIGRKPILRKWHESPGEYNQSYSLDFFGGNFKGIADKIPYLKNLGINAIYLNPIFHSPSNHRYDTQDYFKVDPMLGTNKDFASLTQSLHKQNIRIVLDGVFNHTGMSCRWFNRSKFYSKPGAYQEYSNEYAEFYNFTKHPKKYDCWRGVESLPKLNYRSPKVHDIIYRNKNSVMQFWLGDPYRIDGWRLDAANMLGRLRDYQNAIGLLSEMRNIIKAAHPDCFLLGEHFFDPHELLQGDTLDAAMSYRGFAYPVREWLSGMTSKGEKISLSAELLDQQLREFRSSIGWQIAIHQFNLLNSHDIIRLNYLVDKKLHKIAVCFLMTYVGIPCIYYGEEIALPGGQTAESSRAPMIWDKCDNQDVFSWYKQLIQLRKKSLALQQGGLKLLLAKENVYSYARFWRDDCVVVVMNRGSRTTCKLDLRTVGLTSKHSLRQLTTDEKFKTDKQGYLQMDIPAKSAIILSKNKI